MHQFLSQLYSTMDFFLKQRWPEDQKMQPQEVNPTGEEDRKMTHLEENKIITWRKGEQLHIFIHTWWLLFSSKNFQKRYCNYRLTFARAPKMQPITILSTYYSFLPVNVSISMPRKLYRRFLFKNRDVPKTRRRRSAKKRSKPRPEKSTRRWHPEKRRKP